MNKAKELNMDILLSQSSSSSLVYSCQEEPVNQSGSTSIIPTGQTDTGKLRQLALGVNNYSHHCYQVIIHFCHIKMTYAAENERHICQMGLYIE
jgi:hypothetical protein